MSHSVYTLHSHCRIASFFLLLIFCSIIDLLLLLVLSLTLLHFYIIVVTFTLHVKYYYCYYCSVAVYRKAGSSRLIYNKCFCIPKIKNCVTTGNRIDLDTSPHVRNQHLYFLRYFYQRASTPQICSVTTFVRRSLTMSDRQRFSPTYRLKKKLNSSFPRLFHVFAPKQTPLAQ